MKNAKRVENHSSSIVFVPFDNKSPQFQFSGTIKASIDGILIPGDDKILNEDLCCRIMDMRNFPSSPQFF